MVKELKQGILFTLVTMVLLGGVYNVLLVGIGRVVFPAQAEGSLIRRADGTVVGSRLIAQKFTRPEYFHPRPSAADYNAASTSGSNLRAVESGSSEGRPGAHRRDVKEDGVQAAAIPSEMVTASGAGMDPHIPPARRGTAGRARRVGASRVDSTACRRSSRRTRSRRRWGFSAGRESTCSS